MRWRPPNSFRTTFGNRVANLLGQRRLRAHATTGGPLIQGPIQKCEWCGATKSAAREDEWLDAVVSRMPRAAGHRVDAYLAVLEMAMFDGFLAEHEKEEFVGVALQSGPTRGQVPDLHTDYLRATAEVALEDHVVTSEERAYLDQAAVMLGLPPTRQSLSTRLTRAWRTSDRQRRVRHQPGWRSRWGTVLCSPVRCSKTDPWEASAREIGLEPGGVTREPSCGRSRPQLAEWQGRQSQVVWHTDRDRGSLRTAARATRLVTANRLQDASAPRGPGGSHPAHP